MMRRLTLISDPILERESKASYAHYTHFTLCTNFVCFHLRSSLHFFFEPLRKPTYFSLRYGADVSPCFPLF